MSTFLFIIIAIWLIAQPRRHDGTRQGFFEFLGGTIGRIIGWLFRAIGILLVLALLMGYLR